MKKYVLLMSLAALVTTAFAASAQAHTLSLQKAAVVARSVAERDCNADPDCVEYRALKQHCKNASQHRVRCYAQTAGVDSEGVYVCERPVLVKLRSQSYQLLYDAGNRRCVRVAPPPEGRGGDDA